jgi:hypothetical protein
MSDTRVGNGDTFIVHTDDVWLTGQYIADDASKLIGPEPNIRTLSEFVDTFHKIKQTNFPDALQGTLETFIQNQHDSYYDILQNREAIGFMLQNKVAADTEVTDYMTARQFQDQIKKIQQESW